MFSAWALGFQTTRESSVVAANSSMSTATYQTKASVPAGYVIHNSQRADEFPCDIRIIGLRNLFQDRKSCRHPNQCRRQYKLSKRRTKFVNYIRHLEMADRLYAKDGPDRLYANRQKRAASGPREYPTKQPISTKGSGARWATLPTNRGGYPSDFLPRNEASALCDIFGAHWNGNQEPTSNSSC